MSGTSNRDLNELWPPREPGIERLAGFSAPRQGFASFQEDAAGTAREHGGVDDFLWANGYPRHEGLWPHAAAAIERTMGHLSDGERAKILGLNAARVFKFDLYAQGEHT